MNTISTSAIAALLPARPDGLVLPFPTGRRWVSLQQIIRLEGDGNYTTFFFADGSRLMVALTIKRLLARVPADKFIRIHRKHLINRAFVAGIQEGSFSIDLSNGDSISIARRRVTALRQEIGVS
jgi:two-component system, LytTR family, response regulator